MAAGPGHRRTSTLQGMVLVFGSGALVAGLRGNGFGVLSARREEEVAALMEEVPFDAIVVDHADAPEVYSTLLTASLHQPDCKRVLIWEEDPPPSIDEYVDVQLPRPCELVDLVWSLVT